MSRVIWDRFREVAARRGDKPAIVDAATGERLSYRELATQAQSFAEALETRTEHAVALVGEPDIAALPLVLACAAAECCFAPLSDREPPERVLEHLSHLPGPLLLASSRGVFNLAEIDPGAALAGAGLSWSVIEGVADASNETPFLVTHSSGTTGRPKPIAFSQATKLHRTRQSIELFDVSDADTVLSASPLHHSLGQRHFFVSLMTGATLIRAHPFRPDLWLDAVREHGVTFAVPVATHLKILQARFLEDPAILSGFRCIVTSSAPAEPEFKRAILDTADFDFWEIYGMSETACATAVRYEKGGDTAHLGRAIAGTRIRIAGNSADGAGEIEVHSDCLCDGYWGDAGRWADALTEDGYFRSGDLGRLDENGNLVFLGRTNESFESGGLVVFPAEIERVVAELPAVSDCMAFGLPDPIFGNLVAVAYVADGALSDRDMIRYARSKLPKHMWPARLFRRSEFPALASGKVDRNRLAETLRAESRPESRSEG